MYFILKLISRKQLGRPAESLAGFQGMITNGFCTFSKIIFAELRSKVIV
jgi:hypothetical protein